MGYLPHALGIFFSFSKDVLYLGCGNVDYIGWLFNIALVFKIPSNRISSYIIQNFFKENFTIHLIDFKPLYFLLALWMAYCISGSPFNFDSNSETIKNGKENEASDVETTYIIATNYVRPQWIVGLLTLEFKIYKYWNFSFNLGSVVIDILSYHYFKKKQSNDYNQNI